MQSRSSIGSTTSTLMMANGDNVGQCICVEIVRICLHVRKLCPIRSMDTYSLELTWAYFGAFAINLYADLPREWTKHDHLYLQVRYCTFLLLCMFQIPTQAFMPSFTMSFGELSGCGGHWGGQVSDINRVFKLEFLCFHCAV